ncbi:putative signal transduction protein [Escherichia coli]|uniref:Putative signal transduction protein n=1 Tax=Escherichia coli TaxID=562 RepID=A0A376S946_ECOLX|nr:putative signal transduction protein [Escherichia coli]
MEMINIDLLTAMLLEPQLPQISSASLTVDKRHLLYGNGLVDSLPQPEDNGKLSGFFATLSFYH